MSLEPEDVISPEDEAEIQRTAIRGKVEDDLEAFGRMVTFMREHPEDVPPEAYSHMQDALSQYADWAKQQGIGLPQPDVDV